jgi:hypothetical protein
MWLMIEKFRELFASPPQRWLSEAIPQKVWFVRWKESCASTFVMTGVGDGFTVGVGDGVGVTVATIGEICVAPTVGIVICVGALIDGVVLGVGGMVRAASIPGEKKAETIPTSISSPTTTHPTVMSRCKILWVRIKYPSFHPGFRFVPFRSIPLRFDERPPVAFNRWL